MVGFFTGSIWNPVAPYNGILNAPRDQLVMDFGIVPFSTGDYIVDVAIQMLWSGFPTGNIEKDGIIYFYSTGVQIAQLEMTFRKQNVAAESVKYGAAFGYAHKFKAHLSQGGHLTMQAGGNIFLLGAQASVFTLPPYVVVSPGFTNGQPGPP